MSQNVLFSIVTVTFNASHTVGRTMESVASQTYEGKEHVVVDGLSQDSTMDIVRSYHPACAISRKDKGLYYAMNDAMELCHGQYVIFLNAGDTFKDPDTLSRVAAMLDPGNLPDVIYGQTEIVDDGGRFLHMRRLSAPGHLDWRSFRNGMTVCHQAFWARRDRLVRYDVRYRYSADVDWCIRIMKPSGSLFYTGLVLVSYLDEGMTTSNRYRSLFERFRIMCSHYGLADTILRHAWFALRLPVLVSRRLIRH